MGFMWYFESQRDDRQKRRCAGVLGRSLGSAAVWCTRVLLPVVAVALVAGVGPSAATPTWGPLAPANPHLGPIGTSTMHGDAGSSDATPLAGPGSGPVTVQALPLGAACPTILQGSDSLVVALCTSIVGQIPTVYLIDPRGPTPLAQLALSKGSLLGGVYAYLDNDDRLVVVDGERRLVRVAHRATTDGGRQLSIDAATDLTGAIPNGDNVTGVAPDWRGNVWFATGGGIVGVVDATGVARTLALPAGEQVSNSISTSPTGTAVATTVALYEMVADDSGRPQVRWRAAYDRGVGRKPGQLSWGTGSTPTYFGPQTGSEYVTIVDNAADTVELLVFRSGTGEPVCAVPVLARGGPGSENSPVGVGGSIFVAGTYGYPYPTVPEGSGLAVPSSAPFPGGMTRVDVSAAGQCSVVWDNRIRSAAVPHLSIADGLLYTVVRRSLPGAGDVTTPLDGFAFAALDPTSGAVLATQEVPGTLAGDTLQMSALISAAGNYLQGTVTGLVAVRPG